MLFSLPFEPRQLEALALATAIGLLMGLERERRPAARAGVRTFGLTGLLGALSALLAELLTTPAFIVAGFVLVAVMIISANLRQAEPDDDPGTTSVIALLVCYSLGAMVWLGHGRLAVMAAVGSTMLLYYKSELRGVAARLTAQDWRSILQFSVLSLIVLPILPNQGFGPYEAINPHQVWLMVVLIAGVSLAGYAALRFVGARYGAPLLGLLGGLVSSTATTMVFARHARENPAMAPTATLVILLANLIMVVRIIGIAWALSQSVVPLLAVGCSMAVLIGGVVIAFNWRQLAGQSALPVPETRNPTELRAALGFGLLYAGVLLCAAWLSDIAGRGGLYLLAFVSGLTDVDAITLSTLRLLSVGKLDAAPAAVAILLAMLANLAFKSTLAFTLGGSILGRRVVGGMLAVGAGIASGIAWLAHTSL
ncbi:membrane protein [Zoogloea oryzae]|uniref:Membrane protein n=1 Tax=Zoogloea oryzae TaxID=310767 RepID=A0ABQ6F792_9RHOO|nr:MgtC/SapB family protein [Zoogloea oryzae]GLT21428.1 membrane protein [Zoogloea oryzae]